MLINGVPIETFVGVSTDAAAADKLKAAGIAVAAKTLKLDVGDLVRSLSANGDFFGHDKIEGRHQPGRRKDADDRQRQRLRAGRVGRPIPRRSRLKPKMLPNGTQDSGEILTVDTTKLPAKTESVTVPIKVG